MKPLRFIVIIPARYLNTSKHEELAAHCMEDIDTAFVSKVKAGDIMVAGKNFGCGSSREHAPIAIKALRAGKHVICEKPMAGSLEECDQMIKAADENGKLLSIVAQNRYKTPHMKTKQLLDAGAIGPVLFATINSFWWRGENYYDLWWRGTWEKEGGGVLVNQSVHQLDLLLWLYCRVDFL